MISLYLQDYLSAWVPHLGMNWSGMSFQKQSLYSFQWVLLLGRNY